MGSGSKARTCDGVSPHTHKRSVSARSTLPRRLLFLAAALLLVGAGRILHLHGWMPKHWRHDAAHEEQQHSSAAASPALDAGSVLELPLATTSPTTRLSSRPVGRNETAHSEACAHIQVPSEYCSVGHTQGFIADIMDINALQQGFAKRAYNNELILFNGDASPNMLEMVFSACLRFRTLGIENWVMVTSKQSDCEHAQVRCR
jgi:hypothetical protein